MRASCPSPALHCNYCSINTAGISDVRALYAMPGSARPGKSCHPCPRGGCALVLAASARPGGIAAFALPGCGQGEWRDPTDSLSALSAARHPAGLKKPLGMGTSLSGPGEGAARCSSPPWGQRDQPRRAGRNSTASRQERFIGCRPQQEWPCSRPPLPQK